ncbi:GNAT family N-acetyltransferase [Rhodococcus spelaei]|uniref:GNAT family N-acetyltransferase n=1 Tax=Rhodococcus spelaei TaxID=2546320 RepID=A0A541BAV7_9NOCA|nr:GNAT family N-acetyltransferase [Rhodococcus spelaei]TQF69482.1 GNAT family N-acetyltransferase [Rhodococcus spelaei]
MTLVLIDHFGADRWLCPPFDRAVSYEREDWWNRPSRRGDAWYVQVMEGDAEVARVELDDPGGINPEHVGVPELGPERLEIQLVEVATAARGLGVGTAVVRALEERHADRRLFAYSEDAHGFWGSLGWDRFDHPFGERVRPLFIQPVRE